MDQQRAALLAGTASLSDTLDKRLMCSFRLLPSSSPLLPPICSFATTSASYKVCLTCLLQPPLRHQDKKERERDREMERGQGLEESHHSKRYEHQVSITCFRSPPSHSDTHSTHSQSSTSLHRHTIIHTLCPQ